MTQVCVSKICMYLSVSEANRFGTISADNGLLPVQHQATVWANGGYCQQAHWE